LPKSREIERRIKRRLRNDGLLCYLLGLLLRRRFQRAGLVSVVGGWRLPEVENLGGRIEVGSCGFYPGVRLECWRGALIRIGSGTYLNRGVEIIAAEAVTIGRDCKIARDVIIMDTDQHAIPGAGLVVKPVSIGDGVWIGARAIILKGVEIGSGSIIGAGAVVTKSVPPGSVVVGPGSRIVKSLECGNRAECARAGSL
jgi:acetyltransferase-like isoleucine patch superfamily enzyme